MADYTKIALQLWYNICKIRVADIIHLVPCENFGKQGAENADG